MKTIWGSAAVLALVSMLPSQAVFAAEGLDLAKKSGCLACHSVDKKIVGPAWKDVAVRYADDDSARTLLIDKVKTGGKGSWDDVTGGVPMPPYAPRVADQDIESLVDFILSLKDQ